MKNLILILAIIIFGCSPKKDALESIEIMTYYYIPNEEQTKLIIDCIDYSKIDDLGNVETIRKMKPNQSGNIYLKSKIDSKIISEIAKKNKNKEDKFYETKIDTNSLNLYCGPTIRAKLKYKNNKVLTFTFGSKKEDPKYSLFVKIQNEISNNYKKKHYQIIDSINIINNQKEFEKFAFRKDTLNFPMPPMPINVSKQIKFPPPNK